MKEIWNQVKDKKYFKIIVGILFVAVVGWLVYTFAIEGMLQFKKNEEAFLAGVKKYYEYNPTKLPKEGGYSEVSLGEMYNGSWVESLYVPKKKRVCSEKSFVRVLNKGGEYKYITYLKCDGYESKVDHTAPEIVLNDQDTVIVHLNSTYGDAGVKEVKDNKDKIDVSQVKVDISKVDTSKVGSYEVTYRVYDESFNVARKSRTVIVAETFSDRIHSQLGGASNYVGLAENNYVQFSGMLWRIVKINTDNTIQLITDNNIANLAYGSANQDYKESNVYKWLNEYFYNHLSENSRKFIVDANWCYDVMGSITTSSTCNNHTTAKVGLLSMSDMISSMENGKSFMLDSARFELINQQSYASPWMVDLLGTNGFRAMSNNDLIGIRPVINVQSDIYITAGNGSYENPYKLQDYTYAKENESLNKRLIGEYVMYSGYTFRIADFDEDGNTKLVATELLKNTTGVGNLSLSHGSSNVPNVTEEGNLYERLNNEAINHISEQSIVTSTFEIPKYKNDTYYDQFEKTKITAKLSIPASYEMFSGYNKNMETYIYWLSDYEEDGSVGLLNGSNALAFHMSPTSFPSNSVKVVLYVKKDLKIASGKGTYEDPYYVR